MCRQNLFCLILFLLGFQWSLSCAENLKMHGNTPSDIGWILDV